MALPEMSVEDRARALESAKLSRTKRAAVLRRISSGELSVTDVLAMADEDSCLSRIKVSALLRALPGYGEVRTRRVMSELHIADSRRLSGIGLKQRIALAERFSVEE